MKRKNHFTLVELVVAMGIMVVVALIIGTAGLAFHNGWQRTVRVTDRLRTNIAIDRIMDEHVRGIFPFTWMDDNDESQYVFTGESDSMFFVTRRRVVAGEKSAFLFIRLKLEDNSLIAEYSFYPRFQWDEEGKYKFEREVIAKNVKEISFQYANLDDEGEVEWVDSWREYSSSGSGEDDEFLPVPLAVQMKVEFMDGTSEVWLRRTAGNSKYTGLSE